MPKANANAHTRRRRHRQVQNNPDNHRQFCRMWHQQHIGQSSIYRSCSIGYRRENATLCHDATVAWCRAGWIAACTTVLCLQFDSPTLDPRFPIPRPIALLLGHIASGHVTACCVALHWVVSRRIGLGQSRYYRVSHTIIGPIWCAFPPCFCPAPLHTLPHHSL